MSGVHVQVKRIYEEPSPSDGARVLVDRLWPRGISKEGAKAVAPSTEQRKWYHHDPAKFEEFTSKYKSELKESPQAEELAKLQEMSQDGTLTLLTASKAVDISEASVLQKILSS